MFKPGLLASTAMTAVALLLSGAPDAVQAQTTMHVADRDANARFLCSYGQFSVSYFVSQDSGASRFHRQEVAVSVIGHGQTVTGITVLEALEHLSSSWPLPSDVSAGIYTNNPSGFPGKLIAGRKHRASRTCGKVTIKIPPTTLQANTKYWIKEKTRHHVFPSSDSFIAFNWYADPKAKSMAYVRSVKGSCSESSCNISKSPWTKQSMGPWFRLK